MNKLNSHELRVSDPSEAELNKIKRNPIYLILDRTIDTYNIGSLFRLADAIGVSKVYLCGNMEYPPSSRIHKAAVGTEKWVPWEKVTSTLKAVKMLQAKGVKVVAIEQDKKSVSWKKFVPSFPIALIAGNETAGIQKQVLKAVDAIVELPMHGINRSFNVWGSTAVIAYKILEYLED